MSKYIIVKTFFDGHFFVIKEAEWNDMVEFSQQTDFEFPFEECNIETGTLDTSEFFEYCDVIETNLSKETLNIVRQLQKTDIPDKFRELMATSKSKSKTKSKLKSKSKKIVNDSD